MELKMDDLILYYPQGHENHYEIGHPERPERVEAIKTALQENGYWDLYPQLEPLSLPDDVLWKIHRPDYLEALEEVCRKGMHFDADTYTRPASWDLAHNAAGGAAAVASAVWGRSAKRGFALNRPPGHHATSQRAMGFCLLNNVAIAAQKLIHSNGAKRLAIIDLDLHHGNGTQDIFWRRNDVFYLSTHQSPLYPGTGGLEEIGSGPGKGFTANFPLPPGTGDRGFLSITRELILPLLNRYKPEIMLISVGFDPHWRDPLGHLLLSAGGYCDLISELKSWADEHCDGKIALFLEGGYDLDAGVSCVQSWIAGLMDYAWQDNLGISSKEEGNSWMQVKDRALEVWKL